MGSLTYDRIWNATLRECAHGSDKDTLLHIAVQLQRERLLEWLAMQPELDVGRPNGSHHTAEEVARTAGGQTWALYQRFLTTREAALLDEGKALGTGLLVG
jgi:hypothetical protein